MIRAALIGVTGYGNYYLSQLLRLHAEGNLQLLGVVIRHPEKAEKQIQQLNEVGAQIFPSVSELYAALKGQIDLCCIPTGINSHAPLTIQALNEGCNVLVEKPAAATIQDVDLMKEAEKASGKLVMVGFQNIYDNDVQTIKQEILNGAIGELRSIKLKGLWMRSNAYFTRNNWAGKLKVDGQWILDSPANNAFAHFINIICFLAGARTETSAEIKTIQAELYRAIPIESCDTVCARMTTPQNVSLQFYVTHACGQDIHPEIEIKGSSGSVNWAITRYAINQKEQVTASDENTGMDNSRMAMFDNVIEKLNGGDVPVCDLDIAATQTLCINAMHAASAIHTIPNNHYDVSQTPDAEQVKINDIESILQKAFKDEKLPSELGIPWAKASEVFDCEKFDFFKGTKGIL